MIIRIAVLLLLFAIAQTGWCQSSVGLVNAGLALLADDIDALFEDPPDEEESGEVVAV